MGGCRFPDSSEQTRCVAVVNEGASAEGAILQLATGRQDVGKAQGELHYVKLDNHSPPSGSKGLMLGEILGRSAGLTSALFMMLARFLFRGLGSTFLGFERPPLSGEFSVESEAVIVKATMALLEPGVLIGPSFGVFLETERSAGLISGLVGDAAASGSARGGRDGSMVKGGGAAAMAVFAPLDFCIFINDAGVAGPCRPPFFDLATMAGEFDAEADAGNFGGGMLLSKGSGETESLGETWCCCGVGLSATHAF